MAIDQRVLTRPAESVLATNKVLRNTYALLSMTLLFSAGAAAFAIVTNAPPMHWLMVIGGYFGLLFLTQALRNSGWGILSVFALTGFMGYTLGPIINIYMGLPGGSQIVMTALGGTGVIFLALSGYVLTTRKDFSFMGGMLMAGMLTVFLAMLANIFLQMPIFGLALSAMVILLMAGFILYQTSAIIHGGETNYILATVTLYVALYNIFTSLLHILGIFGGDE
jgi:modulator of FtsH protease